MPIYRTSKLVYLTYMQAYNSCTTIIVKLFTQLTYTTCFNVWFWFLLFQLPLFTLHVSYLKIQIMFLTPLLIFNFSNSLQSSSWFFFLSFKLNCLVLSLDCLINLLCFSFLIASILALKSLMYSLILLHHQF